MCKILIEKQLLQEAAKLLFLLGKYQNNGIDTRLSAQYMSDNINAIIQMSESNTNG